MTKLISHFPSWMTDGIFHYIQEWAPWKDDTSVSPVALDTEYLGNRSGDRSVSPLVRRMTILRTDAILSDTEKERLSEIIRTKYLENWTRLWDALQVEYNPIENYNSIETHTPGVSTTVKSGSKITTQSDDHSTTTRNITSKSKANSKSSQNYQTDGMVKGFGSAEFKAVNRTTGDSSVQGIEDDNHSETTDDGTVGTVAGGTITQSGSADDNVTTTTHAGEDITKRTGNIGVTTSQQMLESEYALRKKHYFDYVMECVDTVLTIPYWCI